MTEHVCSDEVKLLAKQLKDAADAPTMWGPSRGVCDDAADTLLALLAERDRLRDEAKGALAIIATERAEVLKLRAERDRLREPLENAEQACRDRADILAEMGCEMECCVGTANNCADDVEGIISALKGDQT